MLFNFPLGSHKFPDDCVLRPVRPFPLCRLKFDPMLGLSFSICACVVPSAAFTAFPGVFSLFGQSRYSSMSLALTLQDNAGVAGAGRVRLLPGCSWGRQPLRRLLGDSPLNESLCTFQLSWPPLAGGTVTTSSPATIMPFRFTRCSVTFRVHRYRRWDAECLRTTVTGFSFLRFLRWFGLSV